MKNLEREIKTVDTTFRNYTDEMSKYLTGEFEKVSTEIAALKDQVNSHSESISIQSENTGRMIVLFEANSENC